jgi:hypothetical protein
MTVPCTQQPQMTLNNVSERNQVRSQTRFTCPDTF